MIVTTAYAKRLNLEIITACSGGVCTIVNWLVHGAATKHLLDPSEHENSFGHNKNLCYHRNYGPVIRYMYTWTLLCAELINSIRELSYYRTSSSEYTVHPQVLETPHGTKLMWSCRYM